MSQATVCPKCGAILKDDYGMVTCPKCDSILFIDLDGIAQMGSVEDARTNSVEDARTGNVEDAPVEPESFEPHPAPPNSEPVEDYATPFDPPKFDDNWSAPSSAEEMAPIAVSFDEPFGSDQSAAHATQNEAATESTPRPDYFQSNEESVPPVFEPPDVSVDVPVEPPEEEFNMDSFMGGHVDSANEPESGHGGGGGQFSNPDDPLDLNDFANSEISQAKDGHLLFRLYIDGIDSKEIRDSLREAITDQRFAWDASRIMANITKGKLKIDQLPPVKAVILVNRIKRLPIQIRWEQYEITQSDEP